MADSWDPTPPWTQATPLLSFHFHLIVSSGVTSSGVQVGDLDSITVLSGGIASATTVGAGGDEFVSSGGTTFNDVVSGGFEQIAAGGVSASIRPWSAGKSTVLASWRAATISGGAVSSALR